MMLHLTTLNPQPPYRLSLLLDFLSRFAHPTLDIAHQGAYWRVLPCNDGLALLRVTARGTTRKPALDVHLAASAGHTPHDQLIDLIRHILPPHLDRSAFHDCAHSDGALWTVVEPLIGLPELRSATLYEALMQTIIEQQIAWVAAQRAQRWLIEWAGNFIDHDGYRFYAFPAPDQVASARVDDLIPLKITFKRMALLIDTSQQVASGQLELETLRHLPPEAAYQKLMSIKGIGHWTAAVALERAFGYDGWVAHNDVVLQAAANRYFYGGQGRIPAEQVMTTYARYGVFAGLAARYTMFRWVLEQYPIQSLD
jgi:DNA-3-methyladenine glycosylase II